MKRPCHLQFVAAGVGPTVFKRRLIAMRRLGILVLAGVAFGCRAQPTLTPVSAVVPTESRQMIVVTTASWEATSATMQRFERTDGVWEPASDLIPVVVGRSGLGWGKGLHPEQSNGLIKREGGGRAPAGIFMLTQTFGYADSVETGLPYMHTTSDVECVDDSDSRFYNRVLDRRMVEVDWTSHEEMRRQDELYRLGVEVAHNSTATPQGGSCIFLHIWRGPDSTTSGCTAMASGEMVRTAEWLDAAQQPVLVQLPQREYDRLKSAWMLP